MKLKEIKPKYKDKYVIEVEFMHGDADAYSNEDYVCDDEEDFKRVAKELETIPDCPGEGGDEDEYDAWALKVFGDESFIPGDSTCDSQIRADVYDYELFYYDKDGKKFAVEF